ncbi:MAG: DUF2723 domain-containing protein [Chitinivibrionales bacterium]|nr:DUF2723 domain-containing protein [Chitinivibrionales bacterium]
MADNDAVVKHERYNRWIGALVFAIALVVYLMTVAPTVAFWDCGEYIGAAHSLGIPHPPGNPLYVMAGRVFSVLLPFFEQVAYRVNLISVLSAAFTVLFLYLIIVRVVVGWLGTPDTMWKRATVYVGGVVGALFAGFGSTFWFSAVEAETNVVSMVFVVVGTWLALKWAQSKDPKRDRLLILVSYLVFLGIGVHMMSMLAIVPVGLFVLLVDKEKATDWRLWAASILLFSVMYSMSLFLFAAPLLILMAAVYAFMNYKDSRTVNVVLFALAVLVRLVVDFRSFSQETLTFGQVMQNSLPFAVLLGIAIVELMQENPAKAPRFRSHWRFIFWLSLFAILGFSIHMYIPIRSNLRPVIDENHPATLDSFVQFLERKQYGSDNMVTRMFHRRGELSRQFGIDGHMGYGGFHLTQFFHFNESMDVDRDNGLFETYGTGGGWLRLLIYLIPTAFMLFGWYYLWGRSRNTAILLITLMLMGSIALVFYMNFADGTKLERHDYEYYQRTIRHAMSQGLSRAEAEARIEKPAPVHREVRVRDYFFTAGFMWFGVWMGLSASCLLHLLFTNRRPWMRTLGPIAIILLAASPALPLVSNFEESNRTGDWVPYDYAYNLLMSCDKDGILFTNGDNDTFPLWFLQEAEGIRKDVRIVNLSLLNTKWYIKQLKDIEPKVHITFSDQEIDEMPHMRNTFKKDSRIRLPRSKLEVTIPGVERHPVMKVQDQMIVHIVDQNIGRKPIFLAVTVSSDNRMGLDPYLSMEGLVYRVNERPISEKHRVDIERTRYLLDKVYRYTGLGRSDMHLNETTHKLLANYSAGYMYIAYAMRDSLSQQKAQVAQLEKQVADSTAASDSLRAELQQVRAQYEGDVDMVVDKLNECVALMPWDWRPRTLRHEVLLSHGRADEAVQRAREALVVNPDWVDYKKMLAQALDEAGQRDSANTILEGLLDTDKDPWFSYLTLAQNHADAGRYDSAIAYMQRFQQGHPGDKRAKSLIDYFQAQKRAAASIDSLTAPSDSAPAELVPVEPTAATE